MANLCKRVVFVYLYSYFVLNTSIVELCRSHWQTFPHSKGQMFPLFSLKNPQWAVFVMNNAMLLQYSIMFNICKMISSPSKSRSSNSLLVVYMLRIFFRLILLPRSKSSWKKMMCMSSRKRRISKSNSCAIPLWPPDSKMQRLVHIFAHPVDNTSHRYHICWCTW